MDNKLILHIGTPKTGTTALQLFLRSNEALLNEQGFSYPHLSDTLAGGEVVNGFLLDSCMYLNANGQRVPDTNHEIWRSFWNAVKREIKQKNVIISWEGIALGYHASGFFEAVKKEYGNIYVVIYLRRQDQYIESFWNEQVKVRNMRKSAFHEFVKKHKLTYKKQLDEICSIIGKENLAVRIYERGQLYGEHRIISDFLYTIGLDIDYSKCNLPSNVNISLAGNMIEIKRRFNVAFKSIESVRAIVGLEEKITNEITNRFVGYYWEKNVVKSDDGLFLGEERQNFLAQYADENAAIAREYLGREDGILFYDSRPIETYQINTATLHEEILDMFYMFFDSVQAFLPIRTHEKGERAKQFNESKQKLLEQLRLTRQEMSQSLSDIAASQLPEDIFIEKSLLIVEKYAYKIHDFYVERYRLCSEVSKYLSRQQLYLFGTGGYSRDISEMLDLEIQAYIDNDPKKQGQVFLGKTILSPVGGGIDWGNCFVVIAVKKPEIIAALEQQLQSYGLKKGENYIVGSECFMDLH